MKIQSIFSFLIRLILIQVALASLAVAAPLTFNVDGVITKPDGTPLEEAGVTFQIDVRSPASNGNCLLYREQLAVSMVGSSGYFSIPVGKSANIAAGAHTLDKVLGSETPLTGLTGCNSGSTYTATADEDRQVVISFTDSSGSHNFTSQEIKAVPFAIKAKSANSVDGYASGSLLKVGPTVSQTLNSNSALTQTQYDEFWRLVKNPMSGVQTSAAITQTNVESVFSRYSILNTILNGTYAGNAATATALATAPGACPAGQYMNAMTASGAITCGTPVGGAGTVTNVTSANAYMSVATGTSTPVLTLNVGTAANTVAAGNDSRFTDSRSPSGSAGGDLSGTYPNPTVSKVAGKSVVLSSPAAGEVLKYDGTNFVNSTATDPSKLPLAGGTMSGAIEMGSQNLTNTGFVTMSANKNLHLSNNSADPSGLVTADKGKIWFNSTTGNIKYWDGSSAQVLGVAGSGLSSLNSQTGSSQSLGIGTTGASPNWGSVSNTHTLNIPLAATTGTNAGLLSKVDYDAFAAKLGPATTFGGDVSGAYNAISVNRIKGKDVTPGAYSTGQTLRYDGTQWINSALGFTDLTGRPTTVAGYGITDAMSNSLANGKIFIGNGSGVASAVSISGDATLSAVGSLTLATVPITKGGTGVTSFTGDKVVTTSAAGALQTTSCALNQVISFTAGGAITCVNMSAAANAFIQQGNSFAAGAILGTDDAYSLTLETNNQPRLSILADGKVGIGITNPVGIFDVQGGMATSGHGANVNIAAQSGFNSGITNGGNINLLAGSANSTGTPGVVNVGSTGINFYAGASAGANPQAGFTGLYSTAANRLDMATNGVNRVSLLANGNVVLGSLTSSIIANNFVDYASNANGFAMDSAGSYIKTAGTKRLTIDSAGNVGIGVALPNTLLELNGAFTQHGMPAPAVSTSGKGVIYFDSTSNTFKVSQNGGAYTDLVSASSGIPTFSWTQFGSSFPNWSSTGNAHTLMIPMASAAGSTAGLLSKTDYDSFNAKLGAGTAFTGDVSGTYNATSVDKIKGQPFSLNGSYAAGQVLRHNGTGWQNAQLLFSELGGKPTTTAGYGITDALSKTLIDGKMLVGNGSNVATAVSMSGDATMSNTGAVTLATVPVSKGGTGVTSFTGDSLVTTTSTGGFESSTCGLNQVISFTAGGAIYCANVETLANMFLDGGNSVATPATLGTNTAQSLNFETNNSTRMTITDGGSIGVGTTTPSSAVGFTVMAPAGAATAGLFQNNTNSPIRAAISVTNQDAAGYAAIMTGAVKITGGTTIVGTLSPDSIRQPTGTSVTGVNVSIPDISKTVVKFHMTSGMNITLPPTTGLATDQMYTLIVKIKQDSGVTHTLTWIPNAGDSIVWDSTGSSSPTAGRTGFYRFFIVGGENVWYASAIYK